MPEITMQPGKRYRIVFKADTDRIEKFSVMDYLGEQNGPESGWTDGSYSFSARPIAGTQQMPKKWLRTVTQVAKDEPIVINQPYRRLPNTEAARTNSTKL